MKEVLKWSHDYTTGKTVEKTVYKEETNTIGSATIQVFGEDGELKQETFSPNYIESPIIDGDLGWRQFNRLVFGWKPYAVSGGVNDQDAYTPKRFAQIFLSENDIPESPGKIHLFNQHKNFEYIGWCPRYDTDAKSDPKRGVYNPNESYEKYEDGYYHMHYVYDFNTAQANGTFKSIWWGDDVTNYERKNRNSLPQFKIHPVPTNFRTTLKSSANGTFYRLTGNRYWIEDPSSTSASDYSSGFLKNAKQALLGLNKDPLMGIQTHKKKKRFSDYYPSTSEASMCPYPFAYLDCGDGDGSFYYPKIVDRSYTNSSFQLVKMTKDAPGVPSTVKEEIATIQTSSLTANSEHSSGSAQYITSISIPFVDKSKGYVAVSIYFQDGFPFRKAPVYDPKTDNFSEDPEDGTKDTRYSVGIYNAKEKNWVIEPNPWEIRSSRLTYLFNHSYRTADMMVKEDGVALFLQTKGFANSDSRVLMINFNKLLEGDLSEYSCPKREDTLSTSNNSYTPSFYTGCFYEGTDLIVASLSGKCTSLWRVAPGYSAHTLLPEPITKTSTDTMKIQYDIYIQQPAPFAGDKAFEIIPETDENGIPIEKE